MMRGTFRHSGFFSLIDKKYVITYDINELFYSRTLMTIYTATQARTNLYNLINQVAESHTPIHIMGKKKGAVLISEEDWAAMQETLYLQGVSGMSQSIQEGLRLPLNDCSDDLDW